MKIKMNRKMKIKKILKMKIKNIRKNKNKEIRATIYKIWKMIKRKNKLSAVMTGILEIDAEMAIIQMMMEEKATSMEVNILAKKIIEIIKVFLSYEAV